MGSLQAPTLIEDLKVVVHDTTLVHPATAVPHKHMFLSNIDQVLNFDVQTIHFFPANKDYPPDLVVKKLKAALSEILVPYYFLSGRLRTNPDNGRIEFDCNSEGIGFVVASSEYALDDIGDLVYPNPAFGQLVTKQISNPDCNGHPLGIFQVTSFKCGGFAMGVSTNHATFDGLSFKMFLDNLGALAAGKPLLFDPCNERELLAARSPPRVSFPHVELLKLDQLPGEAGADTNLTVFDNTTQKLDFNIFRLTDGDISRLKQRGAEGGDSSTARATGFNVVTAHIWRCKALSSSDAGTETGERQSTLLYAVDIRPKLSPPLPRSFTGNAVLTAYAMAPCKQLEEGPFYRLVEMVTKGTTRMTDEYARSAIDWGELHKGFPNGEFLVSSWWRLGFTEVEYPWGRPRYSCPLVYHRKDIILLFPDDVGAQKITSPPTPLDKDDHNNSKSNNNVNVLVALPPKEMERFKSFFYRFLE